MNTRRLSVLCTVLILFSLLSLSPVLSANTSDKTRLAEQPIDQYKKRRQRLMEKTADGIVVIMGQREDDSLGVDSKFRQNDNFMYLTGVEVPGSILLLIPEGYQGAKEWLFIPSRNLFFEQWTGPQPDPGPETERAFGFEKVVSTREFQKVLGELLATEKYKKTVLYTILPVSNYTRLLREKEFIDQTKASFPEVRMQAVASLIADLRMVKSDPEVAMIQSAIDITAAAHADLINSIKPGLFEYELEGIILGNFYRRGAQRAAFPCIVGSGIFSTVLHYERNRKKIDDGDLIVIDIGAEYNYYAADITRTYPANGRFTPRQREIYKLVLEAQTAAANAFKPGVSTVQDLHLVAKEVMRRSPLRDSKGRTLDFSFIHALSHFLGMYVHDVGDYGRPLPPGAVITIEPGIYLPDEKLGVRIEDDYLVTATGLVKLSKHIPSDPDEIEKLMKK